MCGLEEEVAMRLGSRWGRVYGGAYTDWLKDLRMGAGLMLMLLLLLLLFGRGGGGGGVGVGYL